MLSTQQTFVVLLTLFIDRSIRTLTTWWSPVVVTYVGKETPVDISYKCHEECQVSFFIIIQKVPLLLC